jgi:hypothetical protein
MGLLHLATRSMHGCTAVDTGGGVDPPSSAPKPLLPHFPSKTPASIPLISVSSAFPPVGRMSCLRGGRSAPFRLSCLPSRVRAPKQGVCPLPLKAYAALCI